MGGVRGQITMTVNCCCVNCLRETMQKSRQQKSENYIVCAQSKLIFHHSSLSSSPSSPSLLPPLSLSPSLPPSLSSPSPSDHPSHHSVYRRTNPHISEWFSFHSSLVVPMFLISIQYQSQVRVDAKCFKLPAHCYRSRVGW